MLGFGILYDYWIIAVDDYGITIISRNTGYYWDFHNLEYSGEGSIVIFRKHKVSNLYH